jgi:hypothetical protein
MIVRFGSKGMAFESRGAVSLPRLLELVEFLLIDADWLVLLAAGKVDVWLCEPGRIRFPFASIWLVVKFGVV